jgi:hypothetical protein
MEYKELVPNVRISVLGQGTSGIGRSRANEKAEIAAL